MEKLVTRHVRDCSWRQRPDRGDLRWKFLVDSTEINDNMLQIIMGAVAVGLAMFCMVTTDTEHPPGAAIALGFVLNEWDLMTVAVVLAGICSISFIKESVRSRLIDLL